MIETAVGLPQTDATGLSENWLFKHCGDLHWSCLCEAVGARGVTSEKLRDEAGCRLYPTFVAIRGTYAVPLAAVGLDDRLTSRLELAHFGRTFFLSRVELEGDRGACFSMELLTTFVARDREGANGLHTAAPAGDAPYRARRLDGPPPLLAAGLALRHGGLTHHRFEELDLPLGGPGLGLASSYEPSPYVDYNGAGLLYFAAYPTITDTLERQLVQRAGLHCDGRDWAVATSTVAREIFYHRNLDLGRTLTARLEHFERIGERAVLHTRLLDDGDGAVLADVFTAKRLL